MIENSVLNPVSDEVIAPEEQVLEFSLRPKRLAEFIGQNSLKENLGITLEAARGRGEPIEHLLFYGPPGLGKTTLASIIAAEMGATLKTTSGPAIERAGDLAALLTNLEEGDVLFIDEIHRLHKVVEEILYPAMEDRVLDIMLGKGAGARSVRMELPRFTLIGATTRLGLIASPLRDRFGHIHHLDYYEHEDLAQIIVRSAELLNSTIDGAACMLLARSSRFTPRIANRLLKRVRDFAQVRGHATMSEDVTREALLKLEIDELGLDKNDRRILNILIEKFNGGPVGLSTIAAASGEEVDTITDVYEPFLIRQGFLVRTPKGREVTEMGREHLKKSLISNI